jgi:hypothetical protein
VTWLGMDAFYKSIERVATQADQASKKIVTQSAALVTRASQDNFEGAHKRGKPHVGGNKPNIVSGDLRRSIGADPVTRLGLSEYATKVGPRIVYGRAIELGYLTRRAFPYFTPAVTKVTPELEELATTIWGEFLRL